MKKFGKLTVAAFTCTLLLSSCYVNTYNVGKGPQTGVEVKKANHYVIAGLAPIGVSDPIEMAGGATDYSVTIKHSFLDGLLAAITFSIYTPTTTVVTK